MKKFIKLVLIGSIIVVIFALMAGCSSADVASANVSRDADEFRVERRIVFVNNITGEYLLEMQGVCSVEVEDNGKKLAVICKTGEDQFKKHFLGLNETTTYVVEQMGWVQGNQYNYKLIFHPSAIVPTIEVVG